MEFKVLDEKQVKQYSTLDVEKFAAKENFKEAAQKLFDGRKVIVGEKAEFEFRFEYDEILEEVEEIRDYEVSELKELIPKTWEFIGKVKGGAIFNTISKGALTDGLKLDSNVEARIKSIKEKEFLDESKKQEKIALRKDMQKEILTFEEEKGEKFSKDIVWKVWHVSEKDRVTPLIKERGDEYYEKYMEKCKAIGLDKLNEISEIYRERYYGDD